MSSQMSFLKDPLKCIYNGRPVILTFIEAWQLFYRCHYAWLLPIDLYRWDIQGYTGRVYVYLKVKRKARRLALLIHTRSTRGVTLRAFEESEDPDVVIGCDYFQALACRFNEIFGDLPRELRPFLYYEFGCPGGPRDPKYIMHPEREWLVVHGPSKAPVDSVDWSMFLDEPPLALSA